MDVIAFANMSKWASSLELKTGMTRAKAAGEIRSSTPFSMMKLAMVHKCWRMVVRRGKSNSK